MKRNVFVMCVVVIAFCSLTNAEPFNVGTTPKETDWTSWGYVVDGQDWANWFNVCISYGTEATMSGNYVIQEDFLFQVDPSTSGLTDPSSVYGANWWNHDDVYGLGEFFDAGLGTNDQNYYLKLTLGTIDTWEIWYDADRNLVNDGGSEHAIFEGTVDSYFNRDGYFYGFFTESDGVYNGLFGPSHFEGFPSLVNSGFHAGCGEPVPAPGAMLLGILGLGAAGIKLRKPI